MIMMKNLFKKFRENKKCFTLAELLVVVAIVGILVAISIPVFTSQLTKATKATNLANARAAKAAAVAEYLTSENTTAAYYDYDVAAGTVSEDKKSKDAMAAHTNEVNLDQETMSGGTAIGAKKFTKFSVSVEPVTNKNSADVTVYAAE